MNFITLKELKKMVPVASEFKRVPGLKKILEDGIEVILRKQMENHAEVVVYKNGYVSYHAHERYTVFALHNCTHYYYESQGNEHQTIPHNHFEDMEWHIRLVLEGEDRLVRNLEARESETFSYAKWVKLIYQWYLAGVSTNEIARRLEFLGVARPNERLNRKLHEGDDPTYNKWHPSTVLRILNSSAYIGELVSGKTQTASYKGIGLHPVEKKEWHIVENAHEAIILKSDFEKVQARREQNKEKRERAMARSKATREKCYNHLSGMVYCGCCRRNMTFERRVHGTVKETHYGVFICKRKKNTTPCAYHAVPEKMLMMVAMDQIHHLVSTMCEEEKLVKDMMRSSNLDSARSIKMKENSILFRIQEAEERRLRLYEDYKAEILDEDEYSQLKEHYIAEKQRLEHELQKQRQRALELEKRIKICDAQMERMRGILNQNEFDEELVHELIKRIYVGMDNSVEVEFKCSDPYQEVLAIMSEVQNE